MLTYASQHMARTWLEEALGVRVGVCTTDERGHVQFAILPRYMVVAAQKLKERYPDTYVFERTPQYIADTVAIDERRRVRLQLNYGAQRCHASLYDYTDIGGDDAESIGTQVQPIW